MGEGRSNMRRSLVLKSLLAAAILVSGSMAQAQPPGQTAPPAKSQQMPLQLSPAMPVASDVPADPAKMAEPTGNAPPASRVDAATYILGQEDQIQVKMWDQPKFDGSYIIRPDGKISMPLIGEIQAAGLTPLELQQAVDKAALSMLRAPHSSVNVIGVHSKHVYFDGDGIRVTGAMDLVIPTHVLEGISSRGGFTDFASKNKIRILRNGKPLMFDRGGKKSQYFRYSDMISGKHPESNPLLQDGDHVIVN
jgi:polysaccharide biosynthesis/export protein